VKRSLIRWLFGIAAGYDGVLGVVAIFAPAWLFERFGTTPPNHYGYVQFPGALLIIFAAMFASVAWDPAAKRSLIPYGIALKIAYVGVITYYWVGAGIPDMWKPFAVVDAVMMVLFAWAYLVIPRRDAA